MNRCDKVNYMTPREAKQIIKILESADGGCASCVYELIRKFHHHFPQFKFISKPRRHAYYKKTQPTNKKTV